MKYAYDDTLVVKEIKRHTNLTQSDVNRWKFLWMGRLGTPTVAGAAAYGTYTAATAAYQAADTTNIYIKNFFASQYFPTVFNSSQWLPKDQYLLAAAGATAVGLTAYKVLYPRIKLGVWNKVQKFVDYCKTLSIATTEIGNFNSLRAIQHRMVDDMIWQTVSPMAVENGIQELLRQAQYAGQLLVQLSHAGDEVSRFQDIVISFNNKLTLNLRAIQDDVSAQKTYRESEEGKAYEKRMGGIIETGAWGLAHAAKVNALRQYWDLLKDVAEQTTYVVKTYGIPAAALIGTAVGYKKAFGE
jgi:hypothetical protein